MSNIFERFFCYNNSTQGVETTNPQHQRSNSDGQMLLLRAVKKSRPLPVSIQTRVNKQLESPIKFPPSNSERLPVSEMEERKVEHLNDANSVRGN